MFTNKHFVLLLTAIMLIVLPACSAQPSNVDTVIPDQEIKNLDDFVEQLHNNGATVEMGEQITQPFFTTSAQIVRINDKDLQVFQFSDVIDRETAQATISADGSAIGTSMVAWMDTPHFWGKGRMIVLYVGNDATTIDLLNTILE